MRDPDADYDRSRVLSDEAVRDKSGLHVTYFGFDLTLGHKIQAQPGTNGRTLEIFNENDQGRYQINLSIQGKNNPSAWDILCDTHNPAIILPRPFGLQTMGLGGVFVSIHNPEDSRLFPGSELFCTYIHRVSVFYHPSNPFSKEDLEQRSQTLGRARNMDTKQR
jgi:hypothetical protein